MFEAESHDRSTMPRPRFQFRLSTLLWITLAVACWFGGLRVGPPFFVLFWLASYGLLLWRYERRTVS